MENGFCLWRDLKYSSRNYDQKAIEIGKKIMQKVGKKKRGNGDCKISAKKRGEKSMKRANG